MKCNEMKKEIRRLKLKVSDLEFGARRARLPQELASESHAWHDMEVIIRPRHGTCFQTFDTQRIEMRVCGSPELQIPDTITYRTISMDALDMMMRYPEGALYELGKIMADEIIAHRRKEEKR